MKFLIISISDCNCHKGPSFNKIAEITNESLIEYCGLHGYDYLIHNSNPDSSRQISWGRTFLLREKLKDYDWVYLTDSDLMIMNHTIKLEYLISDKYDLVASASNKDIDRINTGSILWKNSPFSHKLIDLMYADGEFANKGYWEQSTLIKLIKQHPELLNNIKIENLRMFNSHWHYWFGVENLQSGDFCVHLAGSDNDFRVETLQALKEYIIKPIPNIQEKVKIWDK